MALIDFEVDDEAILTVLRENHQLQVGDAIPGRTEVEFEYQPRVSNAPERRFVKVTLTYDLTAGEVERLISGQ